MLGHASAQEAAAAVAGGHTAPLDGHALRPWLLEVNSTPRLVNCDHGGHVTGLLAQLLGGLVEPWLEGRQPESVADGGGGERVGGWLRVYP
jgi:hypothetical protein